MDTPTPHEGQAGHITPTRVDQTDYIVVERTSKPVSSGAIKGRSKTGGETKGRDTTEVTTVSGAEPGRRART